MVWRSQKFEFVGGTYFADNDVIITLTIGSSLGDGTNADVYIGLTGKGGIKTEFELVTEGGAIGDENEQGA